MKNWDESLEGYEGIILVNAHCDQRVLHSPKFNCSYCNRYPEAQKWRIANNVSFTGEYRENTLPCPAELARGLQSINGWGGNQPMNEDMSEQELEYYDKVERNESKWFYGSLRERLKRRKLNNANNT